MDIPESHKQSKFQDFDMSYQYRPKSNQEEHNEMMEDEERYERMMLSNKKTEETQVLRKLQDSSEDE